MWHYKKFKLNFKLINICQIKNLLIEYLMTIIIFYRIERKESGLFLQKSIKWMIFIPVSI